MVSETPKEDPSGKFAFEQPKTEKKGWIVDDKKATPEQKQDSLVDHSALQTKNLKRIYQILVFFLVLAIIGFIFSFLGIFASFLTL